MERRKFVKALGAGAAISALAACGTKEECVVGGEQKKKQTFDWKLVTTWPKNYPGLGSAPENFSRLVKQMSGGRLNISVYGAGELVPAFEVFDAVSQGGAEMGHGSAYYWKGKNSATPFFTAIPFGLTAQEMNGWLHYGGGLQLWEELYEQFNVIPFAGGSTGVQMAGWFNKEINSIEDLKGLKMRIPGLGGEVLKRLGGVPVVLPGGEIFTSLQTGVIDASEWVGPYNDKTFGFQKIAKYYYYPGWHEPGSILEFSVNKDAFNALPEDLQAIVRTATRAINQDMLDEYTARNNDALRDLVEKDGVQLRPLSNDILKELKRVSKDVIDELIKGNADAKRIHDSFRAYEKSVTEYHRISELAYLKTREL